MLVISGGKAQKRYMKKNVANKKAGRPKWEPSEADIVQVERLAALGLGSEHIAYFFDKNTDTIYQRIHDTPEFSEAIKRGRAKASGKVLKALWGKIENGDTACILFYLKTKMGWKETQVVENTGLNGAPIEHAHNVKLEESELRKKIKEMATS